MDLFQDLGLDFCKVPKLSDKSKLRAKTACMGGGHVNHADMKQPRRDPDRSEKVRREINNLNQDKEMKTRKIAR